MSLRPITWRELAELLYRADPNRTENKLITAHVKEPDLGHGYINLDMLTHDLHFCPIIENPERQE